MASNSTPPPPSKIIHTPPTPLHGPKYDSWEPFSPRRSSRINSRYGKNSSLERTSPTPKRRPSPGRNHPSSTSKKPPVRRTNSQTFSPPSSPPLPPTSPTRKNVTPGGRRKMDQERTNQRHVNAATSSDEAVDDQKSTNRLQKPRQGGKSALQSSLPTPAKTPRKRNFQPDEQIKSTARVLFPSRPQNADDIMPSPKKSRRSKKYSAFTLESFAEEVEEGKDGDKIQIYTDSHERVPEADEDEDNPFLVRKGDRSRKVDETKTKRGTKYGMTKQVDKAVDHDKGMVYVFRGKKFFRKFDDAEDNEDSEEVLGGLQEEDIRHHAGAAARKRLTRSSIKPRLLFPPKEKEAEDGVADADEEAVTDIEQSDPLSTDAYKGKVVTPVKQHFRPATPPTTVRKARDGVASANESPNAADTGSDPQLSPSSRKRTSPFDTWQRTKPVPGARSVSAKRTGEPMEKNQATSSKRSRSETHQSPL